jgi:hypothetical protein
VRGPRGSLSPTSAHETLINEQRGTVSKGESSTGGVVTGQLVIQLAASLLDRRVKLVRLHTQSVHGIEVHHADILLGEHADRAIPCTGRRDRLQPDHLERGAQRAGDLPATGIPPQAIPTTTGFS